MAKFIYVGKADVFLVAFIADGVTEIRLEQEGIVMKRLVLYGEDGKYIRGFSFSTEAEAKEGFRSVVKQLNS